MSGRNILGSQRAQDILTCRLCSQYLREPRQLPCGHSFCLNCLEGYYNAQCQRSESGRLRSPSVERRRRGLLPCPAAPVCLHVAIVPDDGVAAFPVNQKIADIKEHVVNEMAHKISARLGRSHSMRAEPDTASVRSDETDFSDVSGDTTWSAPAAAGSTDHPDGKSPYPNLAKYAKYFDAEKDESSDTSKYSSSQRFNRRHAAISSSFQHRRRRVHTPSPAAFDDSTRDLRSSRCGSAPHLDSDGISYRPTVRPRQGSSMASPLLRRARPASCIIEELADDQELLHHFGETTGLNETPRRASSTERHHSRGLPTHRENIAMDEDRRSMPANGESARHSRYHTEHGKTVSASSKTMPSQDESPRLSKHHSEKLETGENSSNTVPARDQSSRHDKHDPGKLNGRNNTSSTMPEPAASELPRQHKHNSDYLETGSTSGTTIPEPNRHDLDTGGTSSSRTSARAEAARNNKSHSGDVKTGKTSTSVSSRPGRRVLPDIPTDHSAAETSSGSTRLGDAVHPKTATSNVRQARRLPNIDNLTSTERSGREKDPSFSKSAQASTSDPDKISLSTASVSDPNTHSSSTSSAGKDQKVPGSKFSSDVRKSGPASAKSSMSNSDQTKPSASTKLHDAGHSKSSVTGNKSSSVSQKSQDSGRLSTGANRSQPKSPAASSKVRGAEPVKSSQRSAQTTPDTRSSVSSKSTPKDESPQGGREQKERQSEPSASDKRRSSKSTPSSGSRLTYKVNAATIQPVLMNSKKTKLNSPQSPAANADEIPPHSDETTPTEDVELEEENNDLPVFTQHSTNNKPSSASTTPATANVSPQASLNERDRRRGSSQSVQTDVNSPTDDHSGTDKSNTQRRFSSATDDKTPAAAEGNKDAKNDKKKQQWDGFMAILQAARAKYSSTDNRCQLSESSRPAPVCSDVITPCWRIQRDDFAVPTSIAIAANGSAVIADIANCLLDFTDVEGNIVHSVTGTKPFSVAVGTDSNVYVGDRRSRTVRVFDSYGSDVAQWDEESTSFGWIAGIAALRNGQLAIMDRERCKVSSVFYNI